MRIVLRAGPRELYIATVLCRGGLRATACFADFPSRRTSSAWAPYKMSQDMWMVRRHAAQSFRLYGLFLGAPELHGPLFDSVASQRAARSQALLQMSVFIWLLPI